jgi:phosphoribosylformimino-5-aminoimidazole carboxamide ribonucleotide (ProFAR) isomerase
MRIAVQLTASGGAIALGEELPPISRARELVAAGARELVLLDVDGAVGRDVVPEWLDTLAVVTDVPLTLDARVHDARVLDRLARSRASEIVVHHAAVFEPSTLRWAIDLLGERLIVELQIDDGYVFDAPEQAFGREAADVVSDLHLQGVKRLIIREINAGAPSLAQVQQIAVRSQGVRLTYHGAVRSVQHVAALAALGPYLERTVITDEVIKTEAMSLDQVYRAAE